MQHQIPVIYFLGTSRGRYQPIIPTFIVGWRPERLRVQLAFGTIVGASAQAVPSDAPERRYALREIKTRLHQASFRDAVLAAYGGRCAISYLPEPRLLDAAHIIMDADEELGQPIVSSGLPLTKIHDLATEPHELITPVTECSIRRKRTSWSLLPKWPRRSHPNGFHRHPSD
jgi:putative restriction endonuclease